MTVYPGATFPHKAQKATIHMSQSSVGNLNNSYVGRESELRQLTDLAGQAERGTGRMAIISGDVGIGKSSLGQALCRALSSEKGTGFFVIQGAAYDLGQAAPFAVWHDLFADPRLRGDLRDPAPPLSRSEEIKADVLMPADVFTRVDRYLQELAASQPVAIILEDLQWADEPSLNLLRRVGRRVSRLPLLLVVSVRDRGLPADAPLSSLMPAIVSECQPYRIDLRPLDEPSVGELVRNAYSLPEPDEYRLQRFLRECAEGNPLFIHELLRTLEQDGILRFVGDSWQLGEIPEGVVPPLVRQLIAARLQRLDLRTRDLLTKAALFGHSVPFHLWQALTGASEDDLQTAIEQADRSGLIDRQLANGDIRFSHALFREALYAELSYPQRRDLHRQIAELLAAEPNQDPCWVAEHLRWAGDARSIEWLIRAAYQSQDRYLPQATLECLRQAEDLAQSHGIRLGAQYSHLRASALETLGEYDQSRADLRLALSRAREAGDRVGEWRTVLTLGILLTERDYDQAGQYLEQALDLAREIGDAALIAQSLNRVGNWHTNLDRPTEAMTLHREALKTFERLGDSAGMAETYDLLGMAERLYGNPRASVRAYRQAVALFRASGDRRGLSSSLMTMMLNNGTYYKFDTVFPDRTSPVDWWATAEEALRIAREVSFKAGEALALVNISLHPATRGDYGRALELAHEGYAIARAIGHRQWLINAHWALGRIAYDLLDLELAREHFQASWQEAQTLGSTFWQRQIGSVFAVVEIDRGEIDRGEQILDEVIGDFPPESVAQRQVYAATAELALARCEPERALEIADELLETAIDLPAGSTIPRVSLIRGQALADLGCDDDARSEWETAYQSAETMGYRPLLWRLDLRLAGLAGRSGSPDTMNARITRARECVNDLAGTLPEETGKAFLCRALDAIDEVESNGGSDSEDQRLLTDREYEVLQLITEGRTDREIAECLFISPRTVNNHVTNIFNKLGVSNRPAAVATAIRRNII